MIQLIKSKNYSDRHPFPLDIVHRIVTYLRTSACERGSYHRILVIISLFVAASTCFGVEIHHIRIDGIINPVSSDFIISSVIQAEEANAEAIIIELDTPGGLLEATRDIIQCFLAADVPIIVYVSPAGARAGSAGVFITLAAHIAAMTPGTNIGAAHPVSMGGGGLPGSSQKDTTGSSVMTEKMTNDAAALIRSIAEERGRNVVWAESSVRTSESITAKEALEKQVIDLIANDLTELIEQIDGRTVITARRTVTISADEPEIIRFAMDWRQRLFDRITNPNIAYIFMMLGIYGLIYELSNPGAIFPGVVGVVSLLLAFYAFQTLPFNIVGLLLIIFGIIFLLLEIKLPSYGILTIGGSISLLMGSIMLIDTAIPALRISLGVIIPALVTTILFALLAVGLGLKAQKNKIQSGEEGLMGSVGEALEDLTPKGRILVEGEYWNAKCSTNVTKGENVRVKAKKGTLLIVEPDHSEIA